MPDKKGSRYHRFSAEEVAWLEARVKGCCFQELTDLFNARFGLSLPLSKVKGACYNRGLTNGRGGQFPSGHKPHNAGVKGWGAGAAGKGAQATRFPKGHLPHNHLPVGSERRTTPQRHSAYYQIDVKIAEPNVWKAKHLLVWEAAHGPVPPGHVILFADQNRENCSLENLLLVTRGELAVLNKQHLILPDAELTVSGLNIAKLLIQIRKRRRNLPVQSALRVFDLRQHSYGIPTIAMLKDAMDFAASGGQALLIHPWNLRTGPRCFHGARCLGKLLDQDAARLEATATRLGVRRIVICRRGQLGQHVDLVGIPLQRALPSADSSEALV